MAYQLYKQFIPKQSTDPEWAQRRVFVERFFITDNTGSFSDLDEAKKEKYILDQETQRVHIIVSGSEIVYSPGVVKNIVISKDKLTKEKDKYDLDKSIYKDLIKDIKQEIKLQKEKIKVTQKQIAAIDKIIKDLDKDIKKETDPEKLKYLINEKSLYEKSLNILNEQLTRQQQRLVELEAKDN